MPAHTHPATATMSASDGNASQFVATAGSAIASPGMQVSRNFEPTLGFNTSAPNISLSGLSVVVGIAGHSIPVNNIQPCLGVNYIICMEGVYPSRS